MIKFYPHLTTSISEINRKPTIILHSLCGCNLKCYQCCNYKDIVQYSEKEYWNIQNVCQAINQCKDIYEYIVLSGGEFLLNNKEDILECIGRIREICDLPIILYTNGSVKDKLQEIGDKFDGVHMDWKLPFQLLNANDEEDKELIQTTTGMILTESNINDLISNLQYVIQIDKGLNQIRSVKYPFLDVSAFEVNEEYIKELNNKFSKNTPYEVHTFID